MRLEYAFVFTTGQLLFGGWAVALVIGWLAMRWQLAAGGAAGWALLILGGRLGRGVRLAALAVGAVCLWWAYRFAFDPNLLGGFHPTWAALALVGALGGALAATLPRRVTAETITPPPLRGEAWPY